MRPGTNSLLLNINPTTTAFFPATNLLQWLKRRGFPDTYNLKAASQELRNVRVTYTGDSNLDSGSRKQRVVFSLLQDSSLEFQDSNTGRRVRVIDHMSKSELSCL